MHKKQARKKTRSSKCGDVLFDNLKPFKALTPNQETAYEGYKAGRNLCLTGYAGTGKTYIALSLALEDIVDEAKYKIAIYRSAVQSRDIGFLPGTEEEKMAAYEKPYSQIVNKLMGRDDAYGLLKTKRVISFESTSFLRGITLDNTVVLLDEAQNLDDGEINTILTRLGKNSRVIICGDIRQTDIRGSRSGLTLLNKVLTKIPDEFTMVDMEECDIVRSGFVKKWIIALEEVKSQQINGERSP